MCNAYCLAHQIQTAVSDKTTSSLCMWLSFQLQQTLKSHPDKKKLFLALCSCCVLIMNVPLCREAPVFAKKTLKVFLHIFAGCLGALEWTLSEARHLRYGGRYICVDPVWRKMVRGAGERQRSTGRHFFSPCVLKKVFTYTNNLDGGTLLSCRWVTSLGHTTELKPSSRTGMALCWLAPSVGKDTGPPRSTLRVKSLVVSGRPMISRYALCRWTFFML